MSRPQLPHSRRGKLELSTARASGTGRWQGIRVITSWSAKARSIEAARNRFFPETCTAPGSAPQCGFNSFSDYSMEALFLLAFGRILPGGSAKFPPGRDNVSIVLSCRRPTRLQNSSSIRPGPDHSNGLYFMNAVGKMVLRGDPEGNPHGPARLPLRSADTPSKGRSPVSHLIADIGGGGSYLPPVSPWAPLFLAA